MYKRLLQYVIPTKHNEHKPHLLREVGAFVVLFCILATLLVSATATIFVNTSGLFSAVYPSVLVDLTNEARVSNGYEALEVNEKLTQAAQRKANDMAEKGYFAHTSPEGVSPWYWIGLSGYRFLYAGENLAVDFTESVDVNQAWLDSTSHAANILSPHFTEVGIATAKGTYEGTETTFVAQMFGTPIPQIDTSVSETRSTYSDEGTETKVSTQEPEESEPTEPRVEVINQSSTEEEKTLIVGNADVSEDDVAELQKDRGEVEPSAAPGYEKYTKWYSWLVVHPQKVAEYALYSATIIIALTLLLMFFVQIKAQHPKNLLYGLVLLLFLLIAIYINKTGMIGYAVSQYLL